MPWGLTPAHLIILLVIVLIVVGPGKLPDTGAAIGKALKGFKDAVATGETDPAAAQQAAPPAQPVAPQAPVYPAQYPQQPQYPAQYPPQPPYAQAPYQQPPVPGQPYAQAPYPAPVAPQPYASPAAPYCTDVPGWKPLECSWLNDQVVDGADCPIDCPKIVRLPLP